MTDRPKFHMTNAVLLCVHRFKTIEFTSLLIFKYYNHTKCFKYFPALPFAQQIFVVQIMNSIIGISIVIKCLDFVKTLS